MSRAVRISVCALAAAAAVAVPVAGAASKPKTPHGKFMGLTEQDQSFALNVAGKRLQYVTYTFECGKVDDVTAVVSIQDFAIKKSRGAYRFSIFAYASMNYSDDKGYENGQVRVKGRFSKSGRSAVGTVRTTAKRCGDTGALDWHARR